MVSMSPVAVPAPERFVKHFTVKPSGCHEWKSRRNAKGYGEFYDGKKWLATRWLMTKKLGRPLLNTEIVLHSCDNPPCVNPEHLRIGTHAENAADKYARGRDHSQSRAACPEGHEYTEENTFLWGPDKQWRKCRICRRQKARDRRESAQLKAKS